MIEIRADRERVTIEHNDKKRVVSTADQGEAPYQRPVRIRASDGLGTLMLTLRWNETAGHVRVDVQRFAAGGEIMSTDVQDGEGYGGLCLKVYSGNASYRVYRLRKK